MKVSESPVLPMPAPIKKIRKGSKFAFMPDGDHVFVAASERAWMASLSTSELLYEFEKPARFISRIAVSDDGELTAMAQSCGRVSLYEAETGKKVFSRKVGSETDTSGLAFAPRSHSLLHATWRQLTMVEPAMEGSFSICPLPVPEVWPDNPMYYAVAFRSSGNNFVCILRQHLANSAALFRWPLDTDVRRIPLNDDRQTSTTWQGYGFSEIVFTPDQQSFLVANPDGSVGRHSFTGTESQKTVIPAPALAADETEPRFFLGDLCFSPNGKTLAYKLNGILGLWAWPSSECLGKWRISEPESFFCQAGFSNSGREFVISLGGSPSGIFVYRTADFINSDLG